MIKANIGWKVEGLPSSSQSHFNTTSIFVADGTADAAIQALADALEALSNGTVTSITRSILTGVLGPYGDAGANGGTNRGQILMRNPARQLARINIPFLKNTTGKDELEAALEDAAATVNLLNEFGAAIGDVVSVQLNQVAPPV